MNRIDISQQVASIRKEKKAQELQELQSMTMPDWMKTPFDEVYSETTEEATGSVINVDFSRPALEIPKALAASSMQQDAAPWYDQGIIAFRDSSGAILNVIFNKTTDSDKIDITVTVSEGDSSFLKPYSGLSELNCSLFDRQTQLAELSASVNHNGSFMFAEGVVIKDYEPKDGEEFISLRFHQ